MTAGNGAAGSAGKKLRLVQAFLRGAPVYCTWQVTRRCESSCLFCEHRDAAAETEADLETCARVAAELAARGAMVVSLCGGEPLLRPDLPDLVRAVARHHFVLLTTHGARLTPARARALWEAGLDGASVRLDDADPARHDARAGLPGAHARALAALSALAATRTRPAQRVSLLARIDGAEDGAVPDLLRLAAAQGVMLAVEPAFPVATGRPAALAGRLLEWKRDNPHLRGERWFLESFDAALGEGVGACRAGRSFLNVDHRGRVSKCLEFRDGEHRVGDLTRESLGDVLPRLLEAHRANTCRSCWYGVRGEVEGLFRVEGALRAVPRLVRA